MKAAFLLLSTSWLVGADTPPPPALAPAAPAHVVPAPVVGACPGGNCGAVISSHGGCCEATWCEKPGLFARLRERFQKSDCCEAPVTCAPACDCEDSCKGPSLFDRLRSRFQKSDCCEPAPCCEATCGSACDDPCNGGLFARLRNRFKRSDCDSCGCDSGYGVYSGHGAVITSPAIHPVPVAPAPGVPATPEQIQPPKEGADKLPSEAQEPAPTSTQTLPLQTRYPF